MNGIIIENKKVLIIAEKDMGDVLSLMFQTSTNYEPTLITSRKKALKEDLSQYDIIYTANTLNKEDVGFLIAKKEPFKTLILTGGFSFDIITETMYNIAYLPLGIDDLLSYAPLLEQLEHINKKMDKEIWTKQTRKEKDYTFKNLKLAYIKLKENLK